MNPFVILANVFVTMFSWSTNVAYACYGTWPLPRLLGDWFYNTGSWFWDLYLGCLNLASWYQNLLYNISQFVRAIDIPGIMSSWINQLNNIWAWFSNWWGQVTGVINTWWSATWYSVTSYVDMVVNSFRSWADSQLQSISTRLDSVRDSMRLKADKEYVDTKVSGLLSSWADLFNFWGSFSGQVIMFFVDPLDFIYNKLEDFFERYW